MMFTEPLAVAIVKGEKTATRRGINWQNPRSPWARRTASYPVGKVFTINPGRGVRRIAEAKVTGRYLHRLEQMTEADARREGFADLAAFAETWSKINPFPRDMPGSLVHVIEFKLVGLECLLCDDGQGCADCFGTGVDVTPEARELIARVEAS